MLWCPVWGVTWCGVVGRLLGTNVGPLGPVPRETGTKASESSRLHSFM